MKNKLPVTTLLLTLLGDWLFKPRDIKCVKKKMAGFGKTLIYHIQ